MIVPENYLHKHQTARLTIRPLDETYIVPWTRFLQDEESTRYLSPFLSDDAAENARSWITRQQDRYREGTFGILALHDNGNNFVGQCGLIAQNVHGEQLLEIGYHLFPEYRGRGYASEAATYFRDYVFENAIAPFVVSMILKGNTASIAVASRNGMTSWKETRWRDMDVVIFKTEKPDKSEPVK
jgi:[ribosomal protein S5]-alanine N-acetyltransferase